MLLIFLIFVTIMSESDSGSIYTPLMINDTEYLFMALLAICVSPLSVQSTSVWFESYHKYKIFRVEDIEAENYRKMQSTSGCHSPKGSPFYSESLSCLANSYCQCGILGVHTAQTGGQIGMVGKIHLVISNQLLSSWLTPHESCNLCKCHFSDLQRES